MTPARVLQSERGFTLIESMMVVIIIGILAAILTQAVPFVEGKVRDKSRMHNLENLQKVIELVHSDTGAYPAQLSGASWVSFFSEADGFSSSVPAPTQATRTYIPGVVPTYYSDLPLDPKPGASSIAGCLALGQNRTIGYFSNSEHYKLVYNCASETNDYDPESRFYDPLRPDWAWAISDDMDLTSGPGYVW